MSEYQYYEFRAIDRPLTPEEQSTVGSLSSRVNLSPNHAIFVYNYSDFPGNAEEILAKYFDAVFYIANWGSVQLMFRFPKNAIDLEQIQAYCRPLIIEEFVSFSERDDYLVFKINWYQEAPEWGWIEGEEWLPQMIGLRDDILRGDYRLLYLAWLKAIDVDEEMIDEVEEPPVPPGLRQLSPGLQAFIELFELDESLVAAAAEVSGSPETVSEAELRRAIGQLAPETRDVWLLRLAQGEPLLSVAFNRELFKLLDRLQQAQPSRRTVGDLFAAAERIEEAARSKRLSEAKARHLKKMESLATREAQIWQEIIELIGRKTGSAYQEAVDHLKDLRDLAKHQGEESAFQARLNTIYRDYSRYSALLRRLRSAGLYEL